MSTPAASPSPAARPPCPACGQDFDCGARAGACWCQDLPPVDRARLPAAAEGRCLCPDCLRAHADPAPWP